RHSDVRTAPERDLGARDSEIAVRRIPDRPYARAGEMRSALIAQHQRAGIDRPGATGQLRAPARAAHATAIDEVERGGEVLRAFEKKRPFLWILERKAAIQIDLQRVGFDLA